MRMTRIAVTLTLAALVASAESSAEVSRSD